MPKSWEKYYVEFSDCIDPDQDQLLLIITLLDDEDGIADEWLQVNGYTESGVETTDDVKPGEFLWVDIIIEDTGEEATAFKIVHQATLRHYSEQNSWFNSGSDSQADFVSKWFGLDPALVFEVAMEDREL